MPEGKEPTDRARTIAHDVAFADPLYSIADVARKIEAAFPEYDRLVDACKSASELCHFLCNNVMLETRAAMEVGDKRTLFREVLKSLDPPKPKLGEVRVISIPQEGASQPPYDRPWCVESFYREKWKRMANYWSEEIANGQAERLRALIAEVRQEREESQR